ncbi:hypothetical protein TWF730_003076 [Orbilia blumenaviensis]|uniref:Uncharacterized protein n=1 Tax=Orbilia blumenaviensis TaxID=1796055 RepID=A0AAV9UA84_9PEZI
MKFSTSLVFSSTLYGASIVYATGDSPGCNANNCLRAVRATAFPTRPGTADCSSYFSTTVVQHIKTVDWTRTTSYATIIPTDIPAYASACDGSVKYSSACSCIGATPVTSYVCAPGWDKCYGQCYDLSRDPRNCGSCGNKCPSGKCVNGKCASNTCNGSYCGNLKSCGKDCFCFKDASGKGSCGPNVSCKKLKGCQTNRDCKGGDVCAVGTCCGRKVCLGSCSRVPRSLAIRDEDDGEEGWTAGSEPEAV